MEYTKKVREKENSQIKKTAARKNILKKMVKNDWKLCLSS